MKRLSKRVFFLMILVIILSCNLVNAASATMRLSPTIQKDWKVGESVSIYFSIQGVRDIEGLMAIGGTLKYDTNILEYKSISAQNGWANLNYNKNTGSFFTMQDDLIKSGNIFKITFLIIGEPANGKTTVSVTGIDTTDGEIDSINVSSVSTTISILKTEIKTDKNEEGKEEESQSKGNNTEEEKKNSNKNTSADKNISTVKKDTSTTSNNTNSDKNNAVNIKNENEKKKEQKNTDDISKNIIKNDEEDTTVLNKNQNELQEEIKEIKDYSINIVKWGLIGICITTLVVALITLEKTVVEERKNKKNNKEDKKDI